MCPLKVIGVYQIQLETVKIHKVRRKLLFYSLFQVDCGFLEHEKVLAWIISSAFREFTHKNAEHLETFREKTRVYRIKFLTKNADFFPFVLSLSCATLGLRCWDTNRVLLCIGGFWMACKSIINFISIRCTWDFLIRPTISLQNLPVNLFKMSTTTFFVFCSRLLNWMDVIIRQILKGKLELNFRFVETLFT